MGRERPFARAARGLDRYRSWSWSSPWSGRVVGVGNRSWSWSIPWSGRVVGVGEERKRLARVSPQLPRDVAVVGELAIRFSDDEIQISVPIHIREGRDATVADVDAVERALSFLFFWRARRLRALAEPKAGAMNASGRIDW